MSSKYPAVTSDVKLVGSRATNLVTFEQEAVPDGDTLDYIIVVTGASARKVYAIQVDASLLSDDAFVKLYFSSAAPSGGVGTDVPDVIVRGSAGKKVQYTFSTGITFTNNIFGVVLTTGGTAGTTGPSATTTVTLLVAT